jgi:uncharacterized protein YaaW (UPF0174 family)
MFGKKKKQDISNKEDQIIIQNMNEPQEPVINPPNVILKLDEKTLNILTDDGAIERLANLSNTNMIEKLIAKNYCVYTDSKGIISNKLEIILRKKLNLSVSKNGMLIQGIISMNKPELQDIKNIE